MSSLSTLLRSLLALLILSGCASATTPTAPAPATGTPAQPGPPLSEPALEPTSIAITATAAAPASATPTLAATAMPTADPTSTPQLAAPAFSYPIGMPGKPLGDGFFIRHGYAAENTWYNPGYWHTGEDWYAVAGDSAGARVYAIAAGEVVYAGANYPGRVVIVQHSADLYSMYGHLDPDLSARVGQRLVRGDLIGTVLRRGDATPNHLHFEVRTFVTAGEVNGPRPRYPFRCGPSCPPGPGYWPIDAPDHPSALGWRNPLHVINQRMLPQDAAGEVVVATKPASDTATLWSAPAGAGQPSGELRLQPGQRYPLQAVHAGPEATEQTSALAYQLWYRIQLPDGSAGWLQAAVPSTLDTGSDGRPSSVLFNLFPAAETPP